MLIDVAKDPAMLVWLDQAQSRKEHPNENFAREVMELFALGEGHYTEKDITEAARALDRVDATTGSSRNLFTGRSCMITARRPFSGKTGDFDGDDVLGRSSRNRKPRAFITAKLWNFFAGEKPSPKN